MAIDAAIIFITAALSDIAYSLAFTSSQGNIQQFMGFAAVVSVLFILIARSRDLYALPELLNFKSQIRLISVNWCAIFLFLTAVAFAIKMGGDVSRGSTISFAISGFACLLIARVGWRIYLRDGATVRKFSTRKVALIAEETLAYDS